MTATNILTCTNKGCYSQDYHKLDVDSNDVVCKDCGQIVDVNDYMKKTMKNNGQIFKKAQTTKQVVCKQCQVADVPVLLDYGLDTYEVVCNHCGFLNQHLTNFFIEPLRLNPQVEKIEVAIVDGEVVLASGAALPWNDPNRPAILTTEERVSEEKVREVALRKAASRARRQRYEESIAVINAPAEPPEPKIKGVARRASPANAQDMLTRAGFENSVIDDEEPVRRIIKKLPNRQPGPRTASDMLEQAGLALAIPEEDYVNET
jgi:hypothetical protein